MTTLDKTTAYFRNQRRSKLRELLREEFGTRKYRLSADYVHVHGVMPNSIVTGWYLLGSIREVMRERNV